jgi:hypothetical protein
MRSWKNNSALITALRKAAKIFQKSRNFFNNSKGHVYNLETPSKGHVYSLETPFNGKNFRS